MASRITADHFHKALIAAGVVREGEIIRRIVIDAQAGHTVVMHIERFADTRMLDVIPTLEGVEIREGGSDATPLA